MTVPANTLQTYQVEGIRQDLIDVITNISPVDTWFLNSIGTARAKAAINHSWLIDELDDAGANKHVEGSDADDEALGEPTPALNHCQLFRKVYRVSDTSMAVEMAGRKDPMAYHRMKKSKALAKDIEYALLLNASAVSGGSGTARELKGVLGWLATNATAATGTGEELTETKFNDNLGLIWDEGGTPRVTLVGRYNKRKISGFGSNTRDISAEKRKVVAAVDIYESEYGVIMIRLHHVIQQNAPDTIVNLGDLELFKMAWLRPAVTSPLAKTGSSEREMMEAEGTLESLNEAGHGKMTGFYYGQ